MTFKIAKELVSIACLGTDVVLDKSLYEDLQEEEKIVSVLSNAIKASLLTLEDIKREDFSSNVINAIEILLKYNGINMKEYITLLKLHPIALAVEIKNTQYAIKNDTRRQSEDANQYSVFLKLLTT